MYVLYCMLYMIHDMLYLTYYKLYRRHSDDMSVCLMYDVRWHRVSNTLEAERKGRRSIQVGSNMIYISHEINIFRGPLYCKVCGARGPSKLVNLPESCETARAGSNCRASLDAIKQKRNLKVCLSGQISCKCLSSLSNCIGFPSYPWCPIRGSLLR